MTLTNKECLKMLASLKLIKQPDFNEIKNFENKEDYIFHIKFLQAVSKNKKALQVIFDELSELEALSDDYKKYAEERNDILIKYAKKDPDGNPIENYSRDGISKSFNVPSYADKSSEVRKEIEKLDKKYKDVIDARKKQEKEMEELLKEKTKFTPFTIPESMIPKGLSLEAFDGVIYMIEDGKIEKKEEKE